MGRFAAISEEAIRASSKLSGVAWRVFCAYALFADRDGANAYPSKATVAAMIGANLRTVHRAIHELVAAGLFVVGGKSRSGTTTYTLAQWSMHQWPTDHGGGPQTSGQNDRGGWSRDPQTSGPQTIQPLQNHKRQHLGGTDLAAPLPEPERKPDTKTSRWGNHMPKPAPIDDAALPEPGAYPDCAKAVG